VSNRWKPNEEQIKQISTMAGLGMTETQISAVMDVSVSTYQLALKKDLALYQSVLKGRALVSSNILKTAYNQAMSGNTAMLIFWLKCRERWSPPREDSLERVEDGYAFDNGENS